mgnify:FL=1
MESQASNEVFSYDSEAAESPAGPLLNVWAAKLPGHSSADAQANLKAPFTQTLPRSNRGHFYMRLVVFGAAAGQRGEYANASGTGPFPCESVYHNKDF